MFLNGLITNDIKNATEMGGTWPGFSDNYKDVLIGHKQSPHSMMVRH